MSSTNGTTRAITPRSSRAVLEPETPDQTPRLAGAFCFWKDSHHRAFGIARTPDGSLRKLDRAHHFEMIDPEHHRDHRPYVLLIVDHEDVWHRALRKRLSAQPTMEAPQLDKSPAPFSACG